MTYRLIYKSRASEGLDDAELRSIAMFSALNNKEAGIAGLLLHYDGHIMQVLEGEKDAVTALYARITADKRHHSVETVEASLCETPAFETWSMGYRPVGSLAEMDIFFALSRGSLKALVEETNAGVIGETLENYADQAGLAE